MTNNVAIIGEPNDEKQKNAFNMKLKMILRGKHKMQLEKFPTLDKCLHQLISTKYSILLIHENDSYKATIGGQTVNYPEIIYRGIVRLKTGLIKVKDKEIRSVNNKTPIIVLYRSHNEENIGNYNSAGANISIDYNQNNFVDILMRTLDQFL